MPTPSADRDRVARVAASVGSEVPAEDFDFRVHSAFPKAMNLAVAGRRGLVTVTDADADDHPQAIRLASRERFDDWPVRVGAHGRREGGALVFDAPGDRDVRVDLSAAIAAPRRSPTRIVPRESACRDAWWASAARLAELQAEKDAELRLSALCGSHAPSSAMGARLATAARALGDAVGARDVTAADGAAAALVGLGNGLTPAGDDFLCGLLAALWCTSAEGGEDRRFVRSFGEALSLRLDATNAISASFLECAIAGCFSGAVSAVAAAFEGEPADESGGDPRAALERLCASGHSSGMDTATGFLFGLWLRNDDETRRYAP